MKTQIQSIGILFFLLCISFVSFSQESSRNGFWTPVHDTLMIFKVYAEYTGDTTDNGTTNWPLGELPLNPEKYLSHQITDPNSLSYLSRYFYLASFGKFSSRGWCYHQPQNPRLCQLF